jgi:uncharacterized membrane protein
MYGGLQANPTRRPYVADQMDEKLAATLCYALGWISGVVFFLIDKRPAVRFHAAQSIVVFGGLTIIMLVLTRVPMGSLGALLVGALELVEVVLWIVLLVKTYQGEKFRVPVAAEVAENLARKA